MRTLKPEAIPTPLVSPEARARVVIAPVRARPLFPSLAVLTRLLGWLATISWLRVAGRGSPREYGRRFRLLLEDFGGLWIKTGQLLSLRVDLFPLEFCLELSQLQVKAIGFPPAEARRIVEADLGGPLDRIFREFEEAPAAAASMGQVHLARLAGSLMRVAVKVQRPELPRAFDDQLRLIRRIVAALTLTRYRPHMRWADLIWELEQVMLEEMDCRYEAASTRRMRRTLKSHGIYAPKVFYATRRVLVTEFIDGVLMADYIQTLASDPARVAAWREENRIEPKVVGDRLARSLIRQIIEDNLYHGDLHPGNIMLLRDNGVALIDFGASGFLEREFHERFRLTTAALGRREYQKAADLSLLVSGAIPRVDVDEIRAKILRALRQWAAKTEVPQLPYHEKSITSYYNELVRVFFDYHLPVEWSLLRVRRALETLDASQVHLIPGVNYTDIPRRYFRQADSRALSATSPADVAEGLLAGTRAQFEMAERLEEYTLFQAAIVRRHVQLFQAATNRAVDFFATAVDQLAIAATAASMLTVAGFLAQYRPDWLAFVGRGAQAALVRVVPSLDWQLWLLATAAVTSTAAALVRLRRRLRRHDPQPAGSVVRV